MTGWKGFTKQCPCCGSPLIEPLDRIMGVCSDLLCRGPFLAKKSREQETARRATEKAMIEQVMANVESKLDKSLVLVLADCNSSGRLSKVPDGSLPSSQLPEDRKTKFAEHIRNALQGALSMIADPVASRSVLVEYSHRDHESETKPILPVINGCTTCQGFCCRNGGETAFLSAGQFAWQLLSDPTLTIEAIEGWYLGRLPEMSMEGSCVYHTQQGCSLSRLQRASICNDFHCWEMQGVLAAHQEGEQVSWAAFAATDTDAKRIAIVFSDGNRIEKDLLDDGIR